MGSPSFASSAFASAVPQKSNDAFTAATSFSLASVSVSFLNLRGGNVANFGAKEIIGFGDVRRQMPERHLSGVGLKPNLSAGISSMAATVFF